MLRLAIVCLSFGVLALLAESPRHAVPVPDSIEAAAAASSAGSRLAAVHADPSPEDPLRSPPQDVRSSPSPKLLSALVLMSCATAGDLEREEAQASLPSEALTVDPVPSPSRGCGSTLLVWVGDCGMTAREAVHVQHELPSSDEWTEFDPQDPDMRSDQFP